MKFILGAFTIEIHKRDKKAEEVANAKIKKRRKNMLDAINNRVLYRTIERPQ